DASKPIAAPSASSGRVFSISADGGKSHARISFRPCGAQSPPLGLRQHLLWIAHMTSLKSVVDAIGNTPLIRLNRVSEMTGCEILGKAEFLTPGQSVKDRAALFIIRDAVSKGQLRPGGTIVEGTAGNTGIGLAMVADAMGFKTVIVIPET